MAIFHSYVELTEGMHQICLDLDVSDVRSAPHQLELAIAVRQKYTDLDIRKIAC